jgi:hypothetical protein
MNDLDMALSEIHSWTKDMRNTFMATFRPNLDPDGELSGFEQTMWLTYLSSAMEMKLAMLIAKTGTKC